MIEMDNIGRRYRIGPNEVEALRDVSLEIQAGDMVSIVGPSGSGKSTLMNILGLLDRPSTGRYCLDGEDTQRLSPNAEAEFRNRRIGFVFQAFHLLPRMNAMDNVALPLFYRHIPRRERRNTALAWLDRVGLAGRADHRPNQLSGGERQRVAIARALVGNPSILLADEPTGALDTRIGQDIMALFHEVNRTLGVTTIIITHNPALALQCPRRLELNDGRLTSDTVGV